MHIANNSLVSKDYSTDITYTITYASFASNSQQLSTFLPFFNCFACFSQTTAVYQLPAKHYHYQQNLSKLIYVYVYALFSLQNTLFHLAANHARKGCQWSTCLAPSAILTSRPTHIISKTTSHLSVLSLWPLLVQFKANHLLCCLVPRYTNHLCCLFLLVRNLFFFGVNSCSHGHLAVDV